MNDVIERQLVIEEIDDLGMAEWDSFVDGHPEATFFHRAGWKTVIERSFGHTCHFICARRDGKIQGILPLVHIKSRLFANCLVSTGFTVGGGPISADAEVARALDSQALLLGRSLAVEYVEYRSTQASREGWIQRGELYAGFRKPIDPEPEKNLLAIPRKQRAMVRKGIKLGLVSEIDTGAERLHHVYATSVRNLGTPVYPMRYFTSLLDVFGKDVDIVTVVKDGKAVASVMNFYFRDQVLPYYGGGTGAARGLAANDFMYWEVMRRACERGYRVFDFGRSKVGTGAYAFKKNWGFEPEPLTYEVKPLRGDTVPEINPLNPKYRFFVAAWKRLPLAVAKVAGPILVRGLG